MNPLPNTLTTTLILALVSMAGAQQCDWEDIFLSSDSFGLPGLPLGSGLALADLDGDDDLDAVSVFQNFPWITVYLNNGEADPTITTINTGRARFVELADLDGDDVVDLILPLWNGGVEVHQGLGDGTFGPADVYPLGTLTIQVRAIDMNGDDVPDLVATDSQTDTLGVFIAVGDGTFLPAVTYSTGATPFIFAPVDLNLDDRIDIVVPNWNGGDVSVFMNQGDGTLAPAVSVPVSGTPVEVVSGDFNGDDLPDLVVSSRDESSTVLPGLGDGTFGTGIPLFVPYGAGRVTMLDYNGDEWIDLACYPYAGQTAIAWMYTGQGDGTFAPAGSYHTISSPEIVAGDWNGDEVDDLVMIGQGLRIAPGNGDATLDAQPALAIGGAVALAADMNGDGILDLVGVDPDLTDPYVRVALGLGDLAFAPPTSLSLPYRIWHLASGDLNGDGAVDLVGTAYSQTDRRAVVLQGNGDGTLMLGASYTMNVLPMELALADIDEDGQLDLVVVHADTSVASLRRGNGDGTFQSSEPIDIGTHDLVVADLDGDGHLDLASSDEGMFGRRLGNGDGTFQPIETFAMPLDDAPQTGWGLSASDVNGDGVLDILAASAFEPIDMAVCLGTGGGFYAEGTTFPTGLTFGGEPTLAIDDFDGDGVPDVALASFTGNVKPVSVLRGFGDGSFGAPELFVNGAGSRGLTAADFDADGAVDLAVGNTNDRNVTIMFNQGLISDLPGDGDNDQDVDFADFARLQLCFTGAGPTDVPVCCRIFDFDLDDDVDVEDVAAYFDAVPGQ